MKNALILHGAGNNHTGNWFPWLRDELEKKGYKIWVPDLPDSNIPEKDKWINTVFSNKEWSFNNESVLIGHSAGSTLILRILEEISKKIKIKKSILVAGTITVGTKPEYFNYKKGLVNQPFNWVKIKKSCNDFYFICSDNDQYQCGYDQSIAMQKHLGGKIILKKGQGHFNLENSPKYKEFPLLLELIEK